MQESHIKILMNEYNTVTEHWISASKDKGIITNITITGIIVLLGAAFKGYIVWDTFFLITPLIGSIFIIIYNQKSAEYWVAFNCLVSIERIVNISEKKELLAYTNKFKNIIFRHDRDLPPTPVNILQIIRGLVLFTFIFWCFYSIYKIEGNVLIVPNINIKKDTILIIYGIIYLINAIVIIWIRKYIKKKGKDISEARLRTFETRHEIEQKARDQGKKVGKSTSSI